LLLRRPLCRCAVAASLRLHPGQKGYAFVASTGVVAAGHVHYQCLPALVERAAAPGQLRFREELMHELLKQLPPETTPRKRERASILLMRWPASISASIPMKNVIVLCA